MQLLDSNEKKFATIGHGFSDIARFVSWNARFAHYDFVRSETFGKPNCEISPSRRLQG